MFGNWKKHAEVLTVWWNLADWGGGGGRSSFYDLLFLNRTQRDLMDGRIEAVYDHDLAKVNCLPFYFRENLSSFGPCQWRSRITYLGRGKGGEATSHMRDDAIRNPKGGLPPSAILSLLQTMKHIIIFLFSLKSYDFLSVLMAHLLPHNFLHLFLKCCQNGLTTHVVQYKKNNQNKGTIHVIMELVNLIFFPFLNNAMYTASQRHLYTRYKTVG